MATYVNDLRLKEIATGDEEGTWGASTNTNLELIGEAFSYGTLAISGSQNLTITDGGSAVARSLFIKITGTLSGNATLTIDPNTVSKVWAIQNATSGGYSLIISQGSGTNVTIPASRTKILYSDGGGSSANIAEVTSALDLASFTAGSTTLISSILDEDNMASDSATALATQQSIKAYVDSQVGTVDTLAEILANGNTSGGTNLIMSAGDTLTADTIAETTVGAGVTIDSVLLKDDVVNATDIEVGTISANDGVQSAVVASATGVMTIASSVLTTTDINGGTIDGTTIGGATPAVGTFTTANATTVDTTNLEVTTLKAKDGTSAGSIADATGVVTLASSVLTTTDINGGTVDGAVIGGASAAAGTFTTLTANTNLTIAGTTTVDGVIDDDTMATASATKLATSESIKAYVDSQVTAQDLDFAGDSGTGAVDLDSQVFTIAGTAGEIETSASGQTITIGLPTNVTVAGDLTVQDQLLVSGVGPHGLGTTAANNIQVLQGGSFTSTTGLAASAYRLNTQLTGDTGNTTRLTLWEIGGSAGITTPAAAITVTDVASMLLDEPNISLGAGSAVTNASTLKIKGAPTEATNNYALWVAAGATRFDGNVTIAGDLTVDTDTLFVDATNNRVGIGTASPSRALDVTTGIVVNSAGTVTSGFYDGVAISGYDAIGWSGSNSLAIGGYRAAQWGQIDLYTGGTLKATLDGAGRLTTYLGSSTGYQAIFNDNGGANNSYLALYQSSTAFILTANKNGSGTRKAISLSTTGGDTSPTDFVIDTSGSVGIGTVGPAKKLEIANGDIRLGDGYTISWADDGYRIFRNGAMLRFDTNGAERARITSGGYFKASNDGTYFSPTGAVHELRTTATNGNVVELLNTSASPYGFAVSFTGASPDNNSNYFAAFGDTTTTRCYIWSDGDLANHDGVYGTISDELLKQDIVDAGSQWDDLKAIRFRKYRMKSDVEQDPNAPFMLGVVAQELASVSPGLVDEHPKYEEQEVVDDDGNITTERVQVGTTKTVKSSILLMKAAVALQEAMIRIEELDAKVSALQSN